MKLFLGTAFLILAALLVQRTSAQLIPAGSYNYGYDQYRNGHTYGGSFVGPQVNGPLVVSDPVATHSFWAAEGGRMETSMAIPGEAKAQGWGHVSSGSVLSFDFMIVGPSNDTSVTLDIAGLVSLSISSGLQYSSARNSGARVVLLSDFSAYSDRYLSLQTVARQGVKGYNGDIAPSGPGEILFDRTYALLPNTRYGMFVETQLWFTDMPPDGIAATAIADATLAIDPSFAAQHPGYSLVFANGFGSAAVPEPSSYAWAGSGLMLAIITLRGRNKRRASDVAA